MAMTLQYTKVTLDDFLTGLLAALADMGIESVSMKTSLFYRAAVEAAQAFRVSAEAGALPVDFDIEPEPFRKDSPSLRGGITRAVQRDIISLDNPVFRTIRLKIDKQEAGSYLERVPGESQWYKEAATVFVDTFRGLVSD